MSIGQSIGRIALLVLSGSATLSLIGAIAETADTGPAPQVAGVTRPGAVVEVAPGEVIPARTTRQTATAPTPAPDRELERWLRTISYALTALAGFAAAGVVVLLRIASALSRIADRD
ncbi:MAG TPA: hypothetical protein DEP91_13065 [Sphingomonas bacterium]|uniref:Uncharacterized protein n=1 Tax=Sphingomonas bacterium TaxID=1895847 RepID=A0A3D0WE91_9SPHN|nr:hypothetical protein [Sphingomonas bacterium]